MTESEPFLSRVCAGRTAGASPRPTLEMRFTLVSDDRPPRGFAVLSRGTAPRPPKTLSLFGWWTRAIRRPHMVSAGREIFARSVLCELPAFGSALPTCRAGACSRRVTPPRRCLPPNFRVIVMSCLTAFGLLWSNALTSFRQRFVRPNG